jgi:hypothetical protein
LLGEAGDLALPVSDVSVEVVRTKIAVVDVAVEDVPCSDENVVSDGDLGAFGPPPSCDPAITSRQ